MTNTHLDHNCQDGCVKCAKKDAIESEHQRSQGAELLQTTHSAPGTHGKNGDLKSIVTEDEVSAPFHGFQYDFACRLDLAAPTPLLDRKREVGVVEHSPSKTQRLVKANGRNEEW